MLGGRRRTPPTTWPSFTALLDLLQQTAHLSDDLLVHCDSTHVINSVTKWMPGWKRRGWRKGDGKPVLNVEIMKALDEAMSGRRVRLAWVKGHSGHELNEAADRLANAAAVSWKAGSPPDPGPGFAGSVVRHPERVPGRRSTSRTCSRSSDPPGHDDPAGVATPRGAARLRAARAASSGTTRRRPTGRT